MKIVGVTKCPTGIAHTFMAAERLEKVAPKFGYEIKVETQGSQGTENELTKKEIAKADYVIIAADVVIEKPERFYGKRVLKTRIKPLLKNTDGVFERLEEDSFIMGGNEEDSRKWSARTHKKNKFDSESKKLSSGNNKDGISKKNIGREDGENIDKESISRENVKKEDINKENIDKEKADKEKRYKKNIHSEHKKRVRKVKKQRMESADVLGQLMNGASYMIPFVVVGGLLVSLSLSIGGTTTADGQVIFHGIWGKVHEIGDLAFTLMYPILSGFIAFSIAGRATLAPAMIGAMVATDEKILGTEAGTGFIGCIIVGYLVGYLVKWMNKWHVVKEFKPMMPIFIIPLTGVATVSALFIFVLGKPVAKTMEVLNILLVHLAGNSSSAIILGLVLGAMVGVDMGGPINKVAFFFGVASIAQGNLQIMGIVSTSIAVAPLSMGIAALIGKDKFTKEEKSAGIYTVFMGIIGISEGAIPFAASDPGHALPAIIAGSAVTGAFSAACGVTSAVPHGGLVVALFKATNYMSLYFLSVLLGTAFSVAIVLTFKKQQKRQEEE